MTKGRLEAFSDGVIAIIITIMVLEMKAPHGSADWADLRPILPAFLAYVLSYVYLGIYWNNHHHMLHATRHVNGAILWANLHLLFWLSLIPFTTAWMGDNGFASAPVALYGLVLLMAAIAWLILQTAIIRLHGRDSLLARAVGGDIKGRISALIYLIALAFAFVRPWVSCACYALVAVIWVIPDRRIERMTGTIAGTPETGP